MGAEFGGRCGRGGASVGAWTGAEGRGGRRSSFRSSINFIGVIMCVDPGKKINE